MNPGQYIGFGRADWCPNCGAETKNSDDDGVRICLACGEHHKRRPHGRLVLGPEEVHHWTDEDAEAVKDIMRRREAGA